MDKKEKARLLQNIIWRKKHKSIMIINSTMRDYESRIMDFDRNTMSEDYVPYTDSIGPKEEGLYLTMRCGLTGIYTKVDEWKNGHWQLRILDGSRTIAYNRNRLVELETFIKKVM